MESETFRGWPAFDIVSYNWRGKDLYLGLLVLERKGVSTVRLALASIAEKHVIASDHETSRFQFGECF